MTINELMKEVAKEETGWCLCSTPDLKITYHVEESLVEKIVERVINRCEKAMVDALHENDIVDMKDADGSSGTWIKGEFRKRVLPVVSGAKTEESARGEVMKPYKPIILWCPQCGNTQAEFVVVKKCDVCGEDMKEPPVEDAVAQ